MPPQVLFGLMSPTEWPAHAAMVPLLRLQHLHLLLLLLALRITPDRRPQLYVRISNRLVGDYVMTQNNIAAPRNKTDSIAVWPAACCALPFYWGTIWMVGPSPSPSSPPSQHHHLSIIIKPGWRLELRRAHDREVRGARRVRRLQGDAWFSADRPLTRLNSFDRSQVMLEGNFWPTIEAAANPDIKAGGANWCDPGLRDSGHHLLSPPRSNWCPVFAYWTMQVYVLVLAILCTVAALAPFSPI